MDQPELNRKPTGAAVLDAIAVMDRLRSPGGCPWDAEQTHDSLRTYLVEEAYEVLDAIGRGDRAELREELGDLLLQVLFHARIASEDAAEPFDIDDIAAGLVAKLVNRHPHVFAEPDGNATPVRDAASQQRRWDELKRAEKGRRSLLDGVAMGQPALALAAKLVQRAQREGLHAEVVSQVEEAPHQPGDIGEQLFRLATQASLAGIDPEDALRKHALAYAGKLKSAEEAEASER